VSVTNQALKTYLDGLLRTHEISDYCPNGLQVEGVTEITKLVTGVTASKALIDEAIKRNADGIVVHHGYFWKGESQTITGMKKQRLKTLIENDINLYAYHLPLDVHPELGNNRQLADLLGIKNIAAVASVKPTGVLMQGEFENALSSGELRDALGSLLSRAILLEGSEAKPIKTLAWCTGGGQGFIEQAVELGVDAFITGEVSEQTIHTAREMDIAFFAAGHHATERYGAKALGEHIESHFDVAVEFVDIDNPA
jgi:dinuclear metal center YbgI/SA1388 family protein